MEDEGDKIILNNTAQIYYEDGQLRANATMTNFTGNISSGKIIIDGETGRIGIGTVTPSTNLDILDTDPVLAMHTTGGGETDADGFRISIDDASKRVTIAQKEQADLRFETNNADRMTIDNIGKVGIGTTNPVSILDITKTTSPQFSVRYDTAVNRTLFEVSMDTANVFTTIRKQQDDKTSAIDWKTGATHHWRMGTSDTDTEGDGSQFYIKNVVNSIFSLWLEADGKVGIGTTNPTSTLHVNGSGNFTGNVIVNENFTLEAGVLTIKETTTPSARTNYGKIYTKSNNELFFQDGSGKEHLLHGDAFSNLWFHSSNVDTVEIGTAAHFTLIDSFENVGEQDDLGNVVANATNNSLIIGVAGGGKYKMTFHTSISSESASSEMIVAIGISLNNSIDVTGATNADPIVVTSVAHGLLNGDMVNISGATGNTAANGDWLVTSKTPDTFTLIDLTGANGVGNGAYDASSGDIIIKYPGNILMHRELGFGSLGVGGANADTNLVASDKIKLYVANVGATRDLLVAIVNIEIKRIGD